MKKYKLIQFLILLLLSFFTNKNVIAQKWTLYNDYNTSTQLSNQRINSLLKDNSEQIWCGSDNGVSIYNGKTWKHHLEGITITTMDVDNSGNVWIGTNGKGLFKYDGTTWAIFFPKENQYLSMRHIEVDINNVVWIGSESGVYNFDGVNWKHYTSDDGLKGYTINNLTIDSKGTVWAATDQGVASFDGINWKTHPEIKGYVCTLQSDNSNNIWFSYLSKNGIFKWDGDSITKFDNNLYASIICIDPYDNVWAAAQNQLLKFNGTEWTSTKIPNESAGSPPNVTDLIFDSNKNIWLSTWWAGVFKFDFEKWENYTANGFPGLSVFDIEIDNENKKWFATDNGVTLFNDTTWTTYKSSDGLISNKVVDIAIDNNGYKWVATYKGITKFKDSTYQSFYPPFFKDTIAITNIIADNKNNIWCSISDNGIAKLDINNNWALYTNKNSKLISNTIFSLFVDKKNTLWVSTDLGVSKFDGKKWETYATKEGLIDNKVNSITTDKQGNIWFATKNGISRLNKKSWSSFPMSETVRKFGCWSTRIYALVIDKQNNLWAGTSEGIFKRVGNTWEFYGKINNYNLSNICLMTIDKNGIIWLSSDVGIISIE